ncbi:MAG: D-alanine--D-alanine ligase family protein [Candidatus Saccharimonadales bacterium]
METVAVIFGGRSTEHDVSVITALGSIVKPLELSQKYRVETVYIAKDGAWYWDEKLKNISLFTSGNIQNFTSKKHPISLQFDNGLTIVKTNQLTGHQTKQKIDVVFPAMHGTYGEDGSLMGLLDMAGVPYVGCGVSASAVAMDKVLAKQIASANLVPVSKFVAFSKTELDSGLAEAITKIKKDLRYPLFIKPAHLGSSIGISHVDGDQSLKNGLEVAAHYDDKIIIEEAVQNLIEVTLPIIGNDELTPALLERPLTKTEAFFDFETKYLTGGKKGKGSKGAQGYSQLPADLSKELYAKAEKTGLRAYRALGCSGTARIDMLIDSKTDEVYFNEINPLPGSLYSHNWNKAGISNIELVRRLIKLAKERHEQRHLLETIFNTNYLQQF